MLILVKSIPPTSATASPAQLESGNYKKEKIRFQGLRISIENKKGSIRAGIGPKGKKWATKMQNRYGYILGSMGVDKDHVDCYVGPIKKAPYAYIVHQRKAGDWKKFDEDKVMLGFASIEAARRAYLKHYDDTRFLGPITKMPMEEFKTKVLLSSKQPGMIKAIVRAHYRKTRAGVVKKIERYLTKVPSARPPQFKVALKHPHKAQSTGTTGDLFATIPGGDEQQVPKKRIKRPIVTPLADGKGKTGDLFANVLTHATKKVHNGQHKGQVKGLPQTEDHTMATASPTASPSEEGVVPLTRGEANQFVKKELGYTNSQAAKLLLQVPETQPDNGPPFLDKSAVTALVAKQKTIDEKKKLKNEKTGNLLNDLTLPGGYNLQVSGDSFNVQGPFDQLLHAKIKNLKGRWVGGEGKHWELPIKSAGKFAEFVNQEWGEQKTAQIDARKLENAEQYMNWVEEKVPQGYFYENGVSKIKGMGLGEHFKERIDAAKKGVADIKAARKVKDAGKPVTHAGKPGQEQPLRRHLYPISNPPKLDQPVEFQGEIYVYDKPGKTFEIDENHPSYLGSHLLGHEGGRGAYYYYRPATADEKATYRADHPQKLPVAVKPLATPAGWSKEETIKNRDSWNTFKMTRPTVEQRKEQQKKQGWGMKELGEALKQHNVPVRELSPEEVLATKQKAETEALATTLINNGLGFEVVKSWTDEQLKSVVRFAGTKHKYLDPKNFAEEELERREGLKEKPTKKKKKKPNTI